MSEHFCTYFDHRYAAKGLAMWRSLKQSDPSATLHVLCLTEACREILAALRLPDVELISLAALEAGDSELAEARNNRSVIEYYFTTTPCLPRHVFETTGVMRLTYVDADVFFFANPKALFEEIGDHSIGIVEHRFPADLVSLEEHGRFNVGWLTFRRDPNALECLDVWRAQCLEWCCDRVEPGRFAEQKYLDDWPTRFSAVHVLQHKGANVAPWNLNRYRVSLSGAEPYIDDEPLIFFHAHGFQPGGPGRRLELNLTDYRVEATPLLQSAIFDPYEQALIDATTEIARPLALALLADQPRHTTFLREALQVSEADRAARLEVIHVLQRQLDAVHAEHAKSVEVLDRQRDQCEAELAEARARVEAIELSRSWRWTRSARQVAARFLKKSDGHHSR